jgi:CBS domain-containing protein
MDLLLAVAGGHFDATAGALAGTEPLTAGPDEGLDTVARRLVEHEARHAVVADELGLPVGVVSTLDVLRVLAIRAWL